MNLLQSNWTGQLCHGEVTNDLFDVIGVVVLCVLRENVHCVHLVESLFSVVFQRENVVLYDGTSP